MLLFSSLVVQGTVISTRVDDVLLQEVMENVPKMISVSFQFLTDMLIDAIEGWTAAAFDPLFSHAEAWYALDTRSVSSLFQFPAVTNDRE